MVGYQLKTQVLMINGSLNSTVAWFFLTRKELYVPHPWCSYVDLGTENTMKQLQTIWKLKELGVDMRFRIEHRYDIDEVHNLSHPRNLFFFLLGIVGGSMAKRIWICFQKENDFRNGQNDILFSKISNQLYFLYGKRRLIRNPFLNQDKYEVIQWFLLTPTIDLTVEERINILKHTNDCKQVLQGECGQCDNCFRKWLGLEMHGIECSDWFLHDPKEYGDIQKYITYFDKKFHEKDFKRVLTKYNLLEKTLKRS